MTSGIGFLCWTMDKGSSLADLALERSIGQERKENVRSYAKRVLTMLRACQLQRHFHRKYCERRNIPPDAVFVEYDFSDPYAAASNRAALLVLELRKELML